MIWAYILKLAIVLPLVGGMAVGAIWGWRKLQPRLGAMPVRSAVRVVDSVALGTAGRLAVIEFDGRRLLVSVNRTAIGLLAEAAPGGGPADD